MAAADPRLRPVPPEVDIGALPVWLAAHAELRGSARVRRVFDHLARRLPDLARAGICGASGLIRRSRQGRGSGR